MFKYFTAALNLGLPILVDVTENFVSNFYEIFTQDNPEIHHKDSRNSISVYSSPFYAQMSVPEGI